MPDRGTHPYPPVGDPDRLSSIVQRGRSLRRRRQLGTAGAGMGGALAVVAVAVFAFGGGSDTTDQLVADDATTTSITSTTTTTTTSVAPATMTVQLLAGPPAQIRVDDPEQPVGENTQQCVTVGVFDSSTTAGDGSFPVAEGTMCAPGLSTDGTADLALLPTTSSETGTDQGAEVGTDLGTGSRTEIGCAASVVRPVPEDVAGTQTQPGVTTFTVSAPDLPPAEYRVVVSAVSGIGDGCAPEQTGLEREHVAETAAVVDLP
jgi:hypothetical protein